MSLIINSKNILGNEGNVTPGNLGLFAGTDDAFYGKRSDGSYFVLGGSSSIFVVGPTGPEGSTGSQGATGTTGPNGYVLTDLSYAAFASGLTGAGLTAGYYRINDFYTRGYIIGSTSSETYTGLENLGTVSGIEPLIVFANGATCSPFALSETYPFDKIYYNPFAFSWSLSDPSFSIDSVNLIDDYKGVIYYREDTQNEISTHYDFRSVLNRRWRVDSTSIQSWTSGVTYSRGDLVLDNNDLIFQCLETHFAPIGLTGATAFDPNDYRQYSIADFFSGSTLVRNIQYHWLRLWKKDLYILNAVDYALGATSPSGTFSVEDLGILSDGSYINIEIPLGDYSDFLTFGTHNSQTTNDLTNKSRINLARQGVYNPNIRIEVDSSIVTSLVNDISLSTRNLTLYADNSNISGISKIEINSVSEFVPSRHLIYFDEYHEGDYFSNRYAIGILKSNQLENFFFGTLIANEFSALFDSGVCWIESSSFNKFISSVDSTIIRNFYRNFVLDTAQSNYNNIFNCNIGQASDNYINLLSNSDLLDKSLDNFIFGGIEPGVTNSFSKDMKFSTNNEFGPSFENNIIIDSISETTLGGDFQNNFFYSIEDCQFGSSVIGLTGGTGSFINTKVDSGISNIDFTNSTLVYGDFSKQIYKRPDGEIRIRYYDNSDQLVITQSNI